MASLAEFWNELLSSQDRFLPHAVCLDYGPSLWIHAIADGLIAVSYYSIPFALLYFAWKRQDLQFRWIFLLFGIFILACGSTHLMGVWTLFYPDYLVSGAIKAITAFASLTTAMALWPLLPKALAVAGPRQWQAVNQRLMSEVEERQAAEAQLRQANTVLEERVKERTADLELANQWLRNEVDQRVVVEQQLRRAKEQAEQANLAKSKFLAGASHDLRQPIQALLYFTQALAYQLPDESGQRILGDMDRSLAALKSLLDALLDISKLDAGVISAEPRDFPVGELLARIAAEFTPTAREKGLALSVVNSAAYVHSDPTLLGRVLQNLVANAVRYTKRGRILVGCRHRGHCLSIEVWDTGVGIPPDRLADIFEEFTQLAKPEGDASQGLGLGLAIVRRLCRLLQHEVSVRSQAGKGSMFRVDVPLAAERARQAA